MPVPGSPALVLLPGMDGTGELFDPLIRGLPRRVRVQAVLYLSAHLSYEQLAERVRAVLPAEGPYVIITESYFGPVALRLAARPVGDLRAVLLVVSFISRPRAWRAPWRRGFR